MTGSFELHRRLADRFSTLRAARGALPVYGLEHGLDSEECQRLVKIVGELVRRHGIGAHYWRNQYLPLLIAATETGYAYLGTGTDFWPKFASSIGAELSGADREALTSLFEAGHRVFGLCKPVDTPWTRAFRHIAWPITNAVAPREIQRPLANALRDVISRISVSADEASLVEGLRSAARQGWSSRLVEWLANADLAAAMALRLLKEPDPAPRVSTEALDRILADLRSDREARRDVERAVALRDAAVRGAAATGAGGPAPFGRCSLSLTLQENGAPALFLSAPPLPNEIRARVRRAFMMRGARIALWGGADPVEVDHLLSGFPIQLSLSVFPPAGGDFLPVLKTVGLEPALVRRLGEMAPDLSTPIIFRHLDGTRTANQSQEATLSTDARYFILTAGSSELPAHGVRRLGNVGELACLEADARVADARVWLEQRGLRVGGRLSLSFSGGLPLGQGPRGPVYAAGYPVLISPRLPPGQTWPVTARRRGSEDAVTLTEDQPLLLVEAVPGEQTLIFENGGRTVEAIVTFEAAEQIQSFLGVDLEPTQPSVEDLIGGGVNIRVTSSLPLDPVPVVATVSVSRSIFAETNELLPSLPTVISSHSPLLTGLVDRQRWAGVPRDSAVELSVDVGGIWRGRWELRWNLLDCVWEQRSGLPVPLNDTGVLSVWSVAATKPFDPPTPGRVEGFCLLLADIDGRPAWGSGLCAGPRTVLPGNHPEPELPGRLLRRAESSAAGVGLTPVLEAYAGWASATSTHALAEGVQRKVAPALEFAAVRQLCGEIWGAAEARQRPLTGDRWRGLATIAIRRGLAGGSNFPAVPERDVPRLVVRLQAALKAAAPELWEAGVQSLSRDSLGEAFDAAVNEAYEAYAYDLIMLGQPPCDEVDTGNDPDFWLHAIEETQARYERSGLLRLLLPEVRRTALLVPDYSGLSSDDVVALLNDVHVDLERSRWLSAEDLRIGFTMWVEPRKMIRTPGWREASERLLSDRPTARAVRYAALRFSDARAARDEPRCVND